MQLNYKVFGSGKPLFILHGLFGSLDNWQTIAKQLSANYQVYIVDQRNHGKSPHSDEISYSLMAKDLMELVLELGLDSIHLMGHSMGGKTVMQFAMDYPDLTDRIIVVDMAPKQYTSGHDLIFDALLHLDLSSITNRVHADELLKEKIEVLPIRQFLLKNLARHKEKGFVWKMNLPVLHQQYSNLLEPIEATNRYPKPVLFIRGGASDYILEEDIPVIQQFMPEATIETVPGIGHWVHAEAPKETVALILSFLNKNSI